MSLAQANYWLFEANIHDFKNWAGTADGQLLTNKGLDLTWNSVLFEQFGFINKLAQLKDWELALILQLYFLSAGIGGLWRLCQIIYAFETEENRDCMNGIFSKVGTFYLHLKGDLFGLHALWHIASQYILILHNTQTNIYKYIIIQFLRINISKNFLLSFLNIIVYLQQF